jgi:hypothetical protein
MIRHVSISIWQNLRQAALGLTASDSQKDPVVFETLFTFSFTGELIYLLRNQGMFKTFLNASFFVNRFADALVQISFDVVPINKRFTQHTNCIYNTYKIST